MNQSTIEHSVQSRNRNSSGGKNSSRQTSSSNSSESTIFYRRIFLKLVLVILMLLLAFLRIRLAQERIPAYINDGPHDERLMLEYSDFETHFSAPQEERTLVKYLAFPWYLNLPSCFGLSLSTVYGLTWVLAALAVWLAVRRIASPLYSFFAYALILFAPQGLDSFAGITLYRNMIIAPFFFMVLGLMASIVLLIWQKKNKGMLWQLLLLSLALAAVFPIAYFIKEDSFWMKPLLALFTAGTGIGLAVRFVRQCGWNRKPEKAGRAQKADAKKIQHALVRFAAGLLCLLLPLGLFSIQSSRYLKANTDAFAYPHYTLRTQGELAEFSNRVFTIASETRSIDTWSTYDALEQAFAASPTLQSHPILRQLVFQSPWTLSGQVDIIGDFLPWVLITAVYTDPQLGSAQAAEAFFGQVNQELDAAFENGTLSKDSRLQISASGGGRNSQELLELLPDLGLMLENLIFLNQYEITVPQLVEYQEDLLLWQEKLGQPLMVPSEPEAAAALEARMQKGARTASGLLAADRIVIPVLFFCGVAAWFVMLVLLLKKKVKPSGSRIAQMVLVFVSAGLAAGYCIGIIWFSQWIYHGSGAPAADKIRVLMTYGSGAASMLYLAVLLACPLLKQEFGILRKQRTERTGKEDAVAAAGAEQNP